MKPERTMTELVAAIRGGDQDAFTELYNRTSQEVYRSARAVLRDEDEALDVQQDTFVYAYQHLDQLSDPEKLRPWLRSIAMNRAKSVLRRNTPVLFTELENDEGEGLPEQADLSLDASPELSLERKETAELVNEILGELSDGQRAAIAMYYYEQMTASEIADALGVATGTVKSQLARGKKKIEDAVHALEKQGVKLYGLSPVGFLVALMKKQAPTAQAGQAVLAKTLASAGLSAGAKTAAAAGAGAAAVPVAETMVLHATRPFFSTVVGKLVLGVLCAGVVGGGVAGYNWAKDKLAPKLSPILYVDSAENLTRDPTEPTLPVELETTAPAAPETDAPTEPEATAPETAANVSGEDEKRVWGMCGEAMYWTLFKDSGELKLRGSGDMTDYPDAQSVPWYAYRSEIKELELPAELTGIGAYAFSGCTALDAVKLSTGDRIGLPDGLTRIGSYAFSGSASLEGFEPDGLLPDSLTSIGEGAFSGCTGVGEMPYVILPESLASVSSGAFADCGGLRELWVLNRDCVLDESLGLPSDLTVCGFPGSTAEAFARENGYAFEPIVDNSEAVLAELSREENRTTDDDPYHLLDDKNRSGQTVYVDPSLRFGGIARLGTGYLTQVLRVEPACVTEEALREAAQTGSIVLDGKAYPFTDSPEQARQWYNGSEGQFTADAEGWLFSEADDALFVAQQTDAGYCFCMDGYGEYINDYVNTDSPAGWLMLDSSVSVKKGRESCRVDELLQSFRELDQAPDQFDRLLMLNARNELVLLMPWKR